MRTLKRCLEILEKNQDSPDAHCLVGTKYYQGEERDKAVYHWRVALQLDPNHVASLGNMAVALKNEGNFEKAQEYFRKALRLDSSSPDLNMEYAHMLMEQGQNEDAAKHMMGYVEYLNDVLSDPTMDDELEEEVEIEDLEEEGTNLVWDKSVVIEYAIAFSLQLVATFGGMALAMMLFK